MIRYVYITYIFCYIFISCSLILGYCGTRGLMRGMTTLSQGNQDLLVVKDEVGRSLDELGVSESMKCDIFPFSALTLLVG